jgi:hypothetical protein
VAWWRTGTTGSILVFHNNIKAARKAKPVLAAAAERELADSKCFSANFFLSSMSIEFPHSFEENTA